ncbi:MAG: UbiA family prenyltransferase, partial [Cytophagales bacterium]
MNQVASISGILKAKAYYELLKPRLSFLVAFSCAFGYALATNGSIELLTITMLTIGGFLLSGASVCINQIIEKELDSIMTRTMNRPMPTGRVSVQEHTFFAQVCSALSVFSLLM